MVIAFMAVLLVMGGMVIDLGNAYLQKRSAQNEADAAALAGAAAIPTGAWLSAANQYATTNGQSGDQVSVNQNGQDTVNVSVTRTAPTFLLNLLGYNGITVTSTAQAKIEAIGQVGGHVAPYAVTTQVYNNGAGTVLFNENQPGAYGTVDLPTPDNTTGGSCSGNTNAGTPTNVGSELSDQLPSGQLMVGGCLSVKSGASQPSAKVINNIQPGNGMMSSDLTALGNGDYQVNPQPWDDSNGLPPRLMFVPIVNTLPGGNGNATIIGFAWFYAISASNNGNKLVITGQYVTMELPSQGTTYSYTPGALGQVTEVELTG